VDIKDKVAVITGGASGIGKGLAERFKAEGAKGLVLADIDGDGARAVAENLGGVGMACDVGDEAQVRALVAEAERRFGPVDIFCSNAGILRIGDEDQPDAEIEDSLRINALSHVYAARAVAPGMAERGSGYLLNTSSAAGILIQVDSVAYTMSKHAAIGFAEFLAAKYGPSGVRVSVLCPQGVRTGMTVGRGDKPSAARRRARTRGRRRGGGPGHGRGALPDLPARNRLQIHAAQGRGPRPLAARHGQGAPHRGAGLGGL